jgi:hypothetical protein
MSLDNSLVMIILCALISVSAKLVHWSTRAACSSVEPSRPALGFSEATWKQDESITALDYYNKRERKGQRQESEIHDLDIPKNIWIVKTGITELINKDLILPTRPLHTHIHSRSGLWKSVAHRILRLQHLRTARTRRFSLEQVPFHAEIWTGTGACSCLRNACSSELYRSLYSLTLLPL